MSQGHSTAWIEEHEEKWSILLQSWSEVLCVLEDVLCVSRTMYRHLIDIWCFLGEQTQQSPAAGVT